MSKYLTKSLFIIGLQCPRKIYYTQHPETYENKKLSDPFLQALAQGGFQVGALAKVYHPEGIDLSELTTKEAIAKTNELLMQEAVTIFEAAINYDNMLVKVDVLKKNGSKLYLYEVKAKSYDPINDKFLDDRDKYIKADWAKYLNDVAFQTYVLRQYAPSCEIISHLTLVNKKVTASVEGLNQRFKLIKNAKGRTTVDVQENTTLETVGDPILIDVDVTKIVNDIISNKLTSNYTNNIDFLSFEDKIKTFSEGIENDKRLSPRLDKDCKKCEFRCAAIPPLKSGFEECWGKGLKSTDNFVFDIWNFRGVDQILRDGRYLMQQVVESDFKSLDPGIGLTTSARQWLQVKLTNTLENEPYLDKKYLLAESSKWQYPLHFIDFETASVAIPFNAGRRPYEAIAFQFSHHIVNADGTIEHAGQYINVEPGDFPNFKFIRELKMQLEQDQGSIFRYSYHENTILCAIIEQLAASNEPDKDQLIDWIKTITYKKNLWSGARNMIDLCDIVIKSFYHPLMGGSNSLKYVSPAILAISIYLQDKYKNPIYGSANWIKSLNFSNQAWIQYDDSGKVIDPYQLLPKLFVDASDHDLEMLFEEDEIKHGGAAMTAYMKLQFTEMSAPERYELRNALLKYCELDTFAMVILYEYLHNTLKVEQY